MRDLNMINANNQALQDGVVTETVSHPLSWVHASLSVSECGNQVFVVKNYSDEAYLNNYNLIFPQGEWKEVLNSDNTKYNVEGAFLNQSRISADGKTPVRISLPAYGAVFFEKVK